MRNSFTHALHAKGTTSTSWTQTNLGSFNSKKKIMKFTYFSVPIDPLMHGHMIPVCSEKKRNESKLKRTADEKKTQNTKSE